MFKLLIIGAIVYYIYVNVWRESSLPKKSSPFLNSKRPPTNDDQIEDANYTEIK